MFHLLANFHQVVGSFSKVSFVLHVCVCACAFNCVRNFRAVKMFHLLAVFFSSLYMCCLSCCQDVPSFGCVSMHLSVAEEVLFYSIHVGICILFVQSKYVGRE